MKRVLLLLFVASVACAGSTKPIQVVQVSHASLAAAQDLEAQLCWGVANVRLGPLDRTHCTAPIAATIGLTDARHKTINQNLVIALNLQDAAVAQLQAGAKTVDTSALLSALTAIELILSELQQTPQVTQLSRTVMAAGGVK